MAVSMDHEAKRETMIEKRDFRKVERRWQDTWNMKRDFQVESYKGDNGMEGWVWKQDQPKQCVTMPQGNAVCLFKISK